MMGFKTELLAIVLMILTGLADWFLALLSGGA